MPVNELSLAFIAHQFRQTLHSILELAWTGVTNKLHSTKVVLAYPVITLKLAKAMLVMLITSQFSKFSLVSTLLQMAFTWAKIPFRCYKFIEAYSTIQNTSNNHESPLTTIHSCTDSLSSEESLHRTEELVSIGITRNVGSQFKLLFEQCKAPHIDSKDHQSHHYHTNLQSSISSGLKKLWTWHCSSDQSSITLMSV